MISEKFTCCRGGLRVNGVLFRPEGEGPFPVAVVSHGFMANASSTRGYARAFAERGYAAIAFDFCGGGLMCRSAGRTRDMSVLTEKEDLKAVMAAASALPFADGGPVTLVGCSQGGFVSALTAAELPDRVRRLILFYPALCIPDDARAGHMLLARFDPAHVPDTLMCGPMRLGACYVNDVIGMDPFEEIRGYPGPVLIIHGTADGVVSADYAGRAARAYREGRAGRPDGDVQLLLIDGANHGFVGPHAGQWNDCALFAVDRFLEGKALLLRVDVRLKEREEEDLPGGGKRVRLFFSGHADSPFFTGDVREPAYDEQLVYGGEADSCRADYLLCGRGPDGQPAQVRVCNRMPSGKGRDWARDWVPTVSADGGPLALMNGRSMRTYALMRPEGPLICIWG